MIKYLIVEKTGDRAYRIIDRIIENGIYLYIIMMFLSKGESIRSILIYGNFALWLFTLKYRKNLYLLKEPISKLCWIYLGITVISVIFSIDLFYSLSRLKMDPLIFAVLFPVIATVMSDAARLRRVAYVCLFTAVFISLIGYYSYISHDIAMLKPDISLMHVYHNKFSKYLNTLLPVAFILFFIWRKPALKVVLTLSFCFLIFALVLNTSRGGYISFIGMVLVWSVYFVKIRRQNIVGILAAVLGVILLIGILSWFLIPDVQKRTSTTLSSIITAQDRTNAWIAVGHSFKEKPVLGWGYGKKIFHKDEPFQNTPVKKRPYNLGGVPYDDPHNAYLEVLFQQGLIGFASYALLILLSIKIFWKEAINTQGIKSYMLVACVCVLTGNYILHSMFSEMKLRYLAVVLGLGLAAKALGERGGGERER